MPIYEYLCESCGKVNEQLQKVNDPPPARCDECGSRKLAKLVSRSAFQLKGGGWYSDLYASKKEKAAPSKDGADGTATATSSPATTTPADGKPADAKPAPKAEPATPAKAAAPEKKERKKAGTGD
jgi:putative FmdB family regulatory protein